MKNRVSIGAIILIFVVIAYYFYINSSFQIFSPSVGDKSTPEVFPSISIDSIFSDNHSWVATLSAKNTITIIATGDIIPARTVNYKTVATNNFSWPYEKVADFTNNADLTFANLEAPQIKDCPVTTEGMVFCGDKRNINGLVYAGVDLVSLANNHAGNHGEQGVTDTINNLKDAGIGVTGISGPFVKEIKGVRFAFLGYNDISKDQPGVSDVIEDRMREEIRDAKNLSDVVIVTFHWGVEYRSLPDERQVYLGHLAIDSGADLVIGNHPHWIQPVEIYKGKLITYAHGNFVFDQMWSQKTTEGVLGKYVFYGKDLIDVEYFPLKIFDFGQARFMDEVEKQKILDEMKQNSEM